MPFALVGFPQNLFRFGATIELPSANLARPPQTAPPATSRRRHKLNANPQPPGLPLTTVVPDGKVHKFEARDHQFWIDGQPTVAV